MNNITPNAEIITVKHPLGNIGFLRPRECAAHEEHILPQGLGGLRATEIGRNCGRVVPTLEGAYFLRNKANSRDVPTRDAGADTPVDQRA